MKEIWKDIPGYINLYQASNYGEIKSLRFNKEIILKQKTDRSGHLRINLFKNNTRKEYQVHRLILETFIGRCPPGMECRHLDGNPKNNKLDNLKWGTHSENIKDSVKHGTHFQPDHRGSKCCFSKLNNNKIIEIRQLHLEGKSDTEIAKIYSVNKSTINRIINKKLWKHVK